MSVIHITDKHGNTGWQARVGTSTPAGMTRYFACRKYGHREAKRLAQVAELELQLAYTRPPHWRTRQANERRRA